MFLDLPTQILAQRPACLDRQQRAEIADRDAVQGLQAMTPFAEIRVGVTRGSLNERIVAGLQIEKRVEGVVDQRIRESSNVT